MLADIELVSLHGGPVTRRRLFHLAAKSRNAPDCVQRELKAVEIVEHDHVKRRRGGAFIPEAANMNIVVVVSTVSQLVNHRGIAMEGENYRLVGREQLVKIPHFKSVRGFG